MLSTTYEYHGRELMWNFEKDAEVLRRLVPALPIEPAQYDRLVENAELIKVLALPDVKKRLLDNGIDAVSNTPQQFAAYVREETTRWAAVIKNANVKVE